ncbi:F510_1955 family glycosylhydrolase [Candidatus Nitrosotenuis sp. DW1]|uniref:F510_1955 family glycosylhydrolase n=1 Tax=Candidatus Nitrosotenuis sp. DW1 TaxID=2259672 RepID=UPI0015CA2FB2|nr:hypothetical protein [Candidatus Nitrosotenuis sp. DW1]QLH09177.1 hypothetical protein DSQ19_06595 [Candidatus Nitrosotenuis sp. DW1]
MKNKSKPESSKKTRLFITIIAAAITIGIGATTVLANFAVQNTDNPHSNSRTVFWRHIHGLGIDPQDRNVLYIATHGDFYQSVNGDPPVKVDEQRADYMAFNAPYAQNVPLYASGHPATGGNTGLIKSTDGGKTWRQVATVLDPPVDFHAMGVSKSDPNLIIGFDSSGRGLFKTIDAGQNWQTLQFPEYISALAISPSDPNVIFAATGKGIYQSSDGANTWTHIEQYNELPVFALTFDENGILYSSTDEFGLSKSADLGKTWEKINTQKITIMSVAVDAQNQILYIAGYVPDGYQEVYKSSDNGGSWDLIGTNKKL